jgi:hypothetical protein
MTTTKNIIIGTIVLNFSLDEFFSIQSAANKNGKKYKKGANLMYKRCKNLLANINKKNAETIAKPM